MTIRAFFLNLLVAVFGLGCIAALLLIFCDCDTHPFVKTVPDPLPMVEPPPVVPLISPDFHHVQPVPYSGANLTREVMKERLAKLGIDEPIYQSAYYAEVNSVWLATFEDRFKGALEQHGVTGWTYTFNCVHYCAAFRVLAEQEYNHATSPNLNEFITRTTTTAQSLAIVTIGYFRDSDIADAKSKGWDGKSEGYGAPEAHAILIVMTDRGECYWDPQSGPITLSPAEIESIFFELA